MNRPQSIIIIASFAPNAILWILALFVFPKDYAAILHYNVGVGIDFIGASRQILVLPTCGLIIIVGNLILGTSIITIDKTSAYIIWSIIPVIQLILIAAFTMVYFANQ